MKKTDLTLIVFIYILSSFRLMLPRGTGRLELRFWDVGQGDAIFIMTPNGKKILIDGGDNFQVDYKLSQVIPFYHCYIDLIILTHPHYDHINGLNRIMQRCKIGTVMFNDVDFSSRDFTYFKTLSQDFKVTSLYAVNKFEIDNVNFNFLWPSKKFLQNNIADINDVSSVLLLDYGNFEALLTGDATEKVLGNIDYESIKPLVNGSFDVLKVPHHGSKYSLYKPLYSKMKPKLCVVSVGEINRFGHPSPTVINYFEESGCKILRTDQAGDIEMSIP